MVAILTKIWTFLSSKAAEWLGIGAVILSALAMVRKSGANSVRNSEMKETLKDVEIKNEIDANNSIIDANTELHSKWEK